MEMECKSKRGELKKAQKGREVKRLRVRPLDKVSTLSVDGMTMTPLCEERVCQGRCLHTRELVSNLQQGMFKEREEDVRRCDINDRFLSRFLFVYE